MFARSILLLTLSLGTITSCAKDDPAPKKTAPASKETTEKGHAPAGVKPGSHEDWCAEHEVPESQCTRCNPDLIPAFKATGDWCEEHGLPESQCKICNPEIKIVARPRARDVRVTCMDGRAGAAAERRQRPASGDKPPAGHRRGRGAMCEEHGVLEAVCTKCNPKLIPVFQAKGDWCEEHGFPSRSVRSATPSAAASRRRRAGRQRRAAARHQGPVQDQGSAAAGRDRDRAGRARPGGARLEAVATIAYDATRRAEVNARAPGVVRALKVDVGAKVSRGAPLATIESAVVGEDRSRLDAANARVEAPRPPTSARRRWRAACAKDVLAAEQALAEARADLAATRPRSAWSARWRRRVDVHVTAPLAGTVISASRHDRPHGHRRRAAVRDRRHPRDVGRARHPRGPAPEASPPGRRSRSPSTGSRIARSPASSTTSRPRSTRRPEPRRRASRSRTPTGPARQHVRARRDRARRARSRRSWCPGRRSSAPRGSRWCSCASRPDQFEARRVKLGLVEGDLVEIVEGVKPGEAVAPPGASCSRPRRSRARSAPAAAMSSSRC